MDEKTQTELQYIYSGLRRVNQLADRFTQALIVFEELQQRESIHRETILELSATLDRIERLLLILLNKKNGRQKKTTEELEIELLNEHIKSLRTRIFQERLNLDRLLERSSEYGREVPLHITNQIEATKATINELQTELKYFLQE